MKFITIQSGDAKIEIHNSIWGKETIKVNDEVVSSQFSFFGSVHNFSRIENNEEIFYEVKIRLGFGPAVDIYRQGKPLLEFPKYGALRFFLFLLLIGFIIKLIEKWGF